MPKAPRAKSMPKKADSQNEKGKMQNSQNDKGQKKAPAGRPAPGAALPAIAQNDSQNEKGKMQNSQNDKIPCLCQNKKNMN